MFFRTSTNTSITLDEDETLLLEIEINKLMSLVEDFDPTYPILYKIYRNI